MMPAVAINRRAALLSRITLDLHAPLPARRTRAAVDSLSVADVEHAAVPSVPLWLARYVARRFDLVFWSRPQDPGDSWKGPHEAGWPRKVYRPEDYRAGMQVGVKLGTETAPGRFLYDIDLDWADGARHLLKFMPNTAFAFGRTSKPVGHAFYTSSRPLVTRQYEDIDGTMLVELRGTKPDGTVGYQTMLPPSIHRHSGETVEIGADGEITHHDDDACVTAYAVACLVGRHWPKKGRHNAAGSLAGFLCRRGMDPNRVPTIVEVAATIGEDEEVADRVRYAKDTVEKFRAGNVPMTGAPTLAQAVGEAVVRRLQDWLPVADVLIAAIERLNERFAIVSVGNKVVIMETVEDGSIKKLWPFDEFKKLLSKEHIEQGGKQVPLAPLWIAHKAGRRYDSLVYDMPGGSERCGPDDYNGWLGFTTRPQQGDWSKNRDHILKIICGGDARLFEWLLNWMAALAQFPGRHAFTAIVLRGKQGVGKGHFAHLMLGALFHKQQYLHVIGAGMLTGQFNEHLSGKVLVFADESTWGGDPKAANKLKGMVTESTVPIERKFLPLVEEPSCLHIIIASNDDWPVAIEKFDRRFVVFDVAEDKRQDDAYFTPLREELANGGHAAMLHDLLAHDIDESALRHPPSTKGKQEVMLQSLKPIERWWHEKLVVGSNTTNEQGMDVWDAVVGKAALHDDYIAFLEKLRETRDRRATQTELGMFLKKHAKARPDRMTYSVGSLEECRRLWVETCGWAHDHQWPEVEPVQESLDDVPF